MKKFLKIFLGVLFAALLLGTFVFLWQKTRPVKVVYTIVQPKLDTLKQFVVATGKVEPRDEVLIKPQISGIVSDVYKEAGQMVRKGEVIATVKVVPEMGQLSSAESRVSVAEISLAQTRREFGRTETLHDKGVVSDEEFEQGRTDLQKAEEELQNAKENLEIVKNGITSRYKELSNTQIRSTIDGMILDVPIKVGNSVIQANTFNDGTTIASVADMSNMLFRGNVDETDVGKLHEGMPVKLTIGALQNVELDANLEYVSPKATEDNGVIMFEVKAAVKIPADVFVRRVQRQRQHRDRKPRRRADASREHRRIRGRKNVCLPAHERRGRRRADLRQTRSQDRPFGRHQHRTYRGRDRRRQSPRREGRQ